ncbi:helix-turn-helix domain-containing protein, partial [Wenyingzhuangia sp. 1_MG-2023]|nr:helix-turn-helix domain-containing protein [Wenyingzhuangia sp. 1_MG-2023]
MGDVVRGKQVLTTGEVAKYCGVNFRTVIRWIERGHLEAYKLPGRGDNRVPVAGFVRFLQSNEMP